MNIYKNGFWDKNNSYSQEILSCESKPLNYKGFRIFHRIKSKTKVCNVYDIVKENICIGMYVSLNGAKKRIDYLIFTTNERP